MRVVGQERLAVLGELQVGLRKLRRLPARIRGEVDVDGLVAQGLQLGEGVYLAPWVLIDYVAAHLISIGDGCVLAPRAHILAHDASTRNSLGFTRLAPVHIGKRVFIGADTLVLPGVTIGDDCVIGAGSLVSSDIAPASLAVGRPAAVVSSAEEFLERRRRAMEGKPCFAFADRLTPEGRARIRELVGEAGEGYIR